MNINWDLVDMELVGEKLCQVRSEKEMTQNEFIEGTGLYRGVYSKYETGTNKPIGNIDSFLKLLEIHNIDINWLLYGNEKSEETPSDSVTKNTSSRATLFYELKTPTGYEKFYLIDQPAEKVEKFIKIMFS